MCPDAGWGGGELGNEGGRRRARPAGGQSKAELSSWVSPALCCLWAVQPSWLGA